MADCLHTYLKCLFLTVPSMSFYLNSIHILSRFYPEILESHFILIYKKDMDRPYGTKLLNLTHWLTSTWIKSLQETSFGWLSSHKSPLRHLRFQSLVDVALRSMKNLLTDHTNLSLPNLMDLTWPNLIKF